MTTLAGRYTLVERLGAGGMGEVWKAHDNQLARTVAVKLLRDDGTQEDILRFQREAQIAARLAHPNIAAIYEVATSPRPFIAMQFVDGRTIRPLAGGDPRISARVVRDAARAIAFAHAQGVIHRDLKPDNVMMQGEQVFVMDFGLARSVQRGVSISSAGQLIGTPAYMPPEQARGDRVDARADVYALGATLHELVTGRPPFSATTMVDLLLQVSEADPPSIAGELGTIVAKAMEKDASRRYASAGEFAEDLDRWLAGDPVHARRASFVYRLRKRVAKRKMWLAAAAALVALTVALVVVAPGLSRARRYRTAYDAAMPKVQDFLMAVGTGSTSCRALGEEAMADLEAALAIDDEAAAWIWLGRCRRVLDGPSAECWDRALAREPSHPEALFERGRERLEAEIWSRGVRLNVRLEPLPEPRRPGEDDLDAARGKLAPHLQSYLEGLVALRLGRADEAAAAIDRYLQRVRWDYAAFYLRAIALEGAGRRDEALQDLDRAIALSPHAPGARTARGVMRYLAGRKKEAEQDFLAAVRDRPTYARPHRYLAVIHLERGEHDRALAELRRYVELETPSADSWAEVGGEYRALRMWTEAVAAYSRAVDLDPARAHLHAQLGLVFDEAGKFSEAEASAKRALELGSKEAQPHITLGNVHAKRGRSREALDAFTRAIEIEPANTVALTNRGVAHLHAGNLDAALADLDRALELDPRSALALSHRGSVHIKARRVEKALADLTAAVEIDPKRQVAFQNRGLVLMELDRFESAEADFTRAIELDAQQTGPWVNRAHLRNQLRRFTEADADACRALGLDSTMWQAWGVRGMARANLGRYAEAVADFEEAIRLLPGLEPQLRKPLAEARRMAAEQEKKRRR